MLQFHIRMGGFRHNLRVIIEYLQKSRAMTKDLSQFCTATLPSTVEARRLKSERDFFFMNYYEREIILNFHFMRRFGVTTFKA